VPKGDQPARGQAIDLEKMAMFKCMPTHPPGASRAKTGVLGDPPILA
jgi:hypothetical protein